MAHYLSWFLVSILLFIAAIVAIRLAYHQDDVVAQSRGNGFPGNIDYSISLIQRKPVCQCGTDDIPADLEGDPVNIDFSTSLMQRRPVCPCNPDNNQTNHQTLQGETGTSQNPAVNSVVGAQADSSDLQHPSDSFNQVEDSISSVIERLLESSYRTADSTSPSGSVAFSDDSTSPHEYNQSGTTASNSDSESTNSEEEADGGLLSELEDAMPSDDEELSESSYHSEDSMSSSGSNSSNGSSKSSYGNHQSEITGNVINSNNNDSMGEANGAAPQAQQIPVETFVKAGCDDLDEME